MFVRAVAFPDAPRPGYAVIVDLPISETVKEGIRGRTGVGIDTATAVSGEVQPLSGMAGDHALRSSVEPDSADLGRRSCSGVIIPYLLYGTMVPQPLRARGSSGQESRVGGLRAAKDLRREIASGCVKSLREPYPTAKPAPDE